MPENGDPLLLPLLLLNAAGFTFSIGMGSVAIMSMIGDIVDENELLTGERQGPVPAGLSRKHPTPWAISLPVLCWVLRAATPASDPR